MKTFGFIIGTAAIVSAGALTANIAIKAIKAFRAKTNGGS